VWDRQAQRVLVDVPRERGATSVARDARLDWDAAFGRRAPLLVDIGSGLGESTAQAAADRPDWNGLAVEVYVPGLAALICLFGALLYRGWMHLPTLAERREDIPLLANHFLMQLARKYERRIAGF
jgi:hypothetical protein